MAKLYGVATPINPAQVRSTLASIFKYNLRAICSPTACLQRPGYAIAHEPDCFSAPGPVAISRPFRLFTATKSGPIEYQVASHLITEAMVEEGLTIVRAIRSRYDGHVRNPFNEIRMRQLLRPRARQLCLLQSLSGFSYSAVTPHIALGDPEPTPKLSAPSSPLPLVGQHCQQDDQLIVHVIEGELLIDQIECGIDSNISRLPGLGRIKSRRNAEGLFADSPS